MKVVTFVLTALDIWFQAIMTSVTCVQCERLGTLGMLQSTYTIYL